MPNGHGGPDPKITGKLRDAKMRVERNLENCDDSAKRRLIRVQIQFINQAIDARSFERLLSKSNHDHE
jgi:hypothetical protein